LNSQTNLFQVSSFNFKLKHLVIIGVLVLAFSTSFLIRSQPAEYGFELNEFDSFFNFRATEYIVENGFFEYFEWHDDKSWYPTGRDVSATSQTMLHITATITYQIFGGNSSLYDFTILFPAVIGSLTVIVIFALVRLFAGTAAGLFASLLFAVSFPIILRGMLGWFKSEPLGIFYGLLGLYLFLSAIKSENKKVTVLKIIFGGIVMTFALASWGGVQFFIIPLGLFILALPFVRKDHKFLIWSIPLFVGSFLLSALMFERPGPGFVFGMGGILLIGSTIFLVVCIFIQKISKDEHKIRNGLFLFIPIIIIILFLVLASDTTERSYYSISPSDLPGSQGEAVAIELSAGAASIGSNIMEIQCYCFSFVDSNINGNVHARVWDSNMNVLAEGSLPYSKFSESWKTYTFTLNNSVELKSGYLIGIDASDLTGSAIYVIGVGNIDGSHPIGTGTTFMSNNVKIGTHASQIQLSFDSNSSINSKDVILPIPSFRYLNAINPFLTTTVPLVDSVAEHSSVTMTLSFLLHSVWMIFAGIGIWLILSKKISQTFVKNDMKAFVLIFGITGVYISSSFVRLEVFASISLIILSSIALSILTTNIFKIKFFGKKKYLFKIPYVVIIVFLFTLPLVHPENSNWINIIDTPQVIFTGATSNPPTNDWLETLEWIKLNTPENAVIASWWDYGYWIQTMAERTTLIDNSTIGTWQIEKMAKMLLSTPVDSWHMLKEMNADYVLVFLSAFKINNEPVNKLYTLGGGGDESKVFWFANIAELPAEKYLHSDWTSGTNYFDEQTILGKMIPFTTAVYYDPNTQENSAIYKPGFVKIVSKDIKYDSDNDPLKLVYTSPSFMQERGGHMNIILVYEVNKNYILTNDDLIIDQNMNLEN